MLQIIDEMRGFGVQLQFDQKQFCLWLFIHMYLHHQTINHLEFQVFFLLNLQVSL